MKITNNGLSSNPLGPKQPIQGAPTATRDGGAEPTAAEKDLFVPSQQWLRLVDLFHQQPEVRQDRVTEAGQKLREGYYLTADSNEKTAEAIMQAVD